MYYLITPVGWKPDKMRLHSLLRFSGGRYQRVLQSWAFVWSSCRYTPGRQRSFPGDCWTEATILWVFAQRWFSAPKRCPEVLESCAPPPPPPTGSLGLSQASTSLMSFTLNNQEHCSAFEELAILSHAPTEQSPYLKSNWSGAVTTSEKVLHFSV